MQSYTDRKRAENPNYDAERAGAQKQRRLQQAAAKTEATAAAAAAAAPAASMDAGTATSPGFLARTIPSVFGSAAALQQQQPEADGAPVQGGFVTTAALDGLRYPVGSSQSEIGYHGAEWAGLERVHQLLGVQLLEPGLLREEQLARAAARLRGGEAPFNVDEWAESSAAFLVYGDFGPLREDVEDGTLWGRSVIDESFRFVGIHELAGVARASGMPALMHGAESLLRQVLPGAYRTYADEASSRSYDDDEAVHCTYALESAVDALGFYMEAVKESRASDGRLPELIEKLTAAQAH